MIYRLALEKDPDYLRALLVMGQTLLQNGQLAEATGYFERAISKVLHCFFCYAPFYFQGLFILGEMLGSYLQSEMIIKRLECHIEAIYILLYSKRMRLGISTEESLLLAFLFFFVVLLICV